MGACSSKNKVDPAPADPPAVADVKQVGVSVPAAATTANGSTSATSTAASSGAASAATTTTSSGAATASPRKAAAPAPAPAPAAAAAARASPTKDVASAEQTPAGRKLADYYDLKELLGKGGFGEVKAAIRKSDGKKVAVKLISKLKFTSDEDRASMITERDLMMKVKGSQYVVELHDQFEDRWNFFLVMDLCTGGELMDRIIKSQSFSEKAASRYFRQMLEGLKHCHDHGVVHRDLKPENFLLESSAPDAVLKLTDFGLSCAIAAPDSIITDACGSAYYIAPEVFTRRYTKAADVWSAGIILFLLLSGTVPFGADAEHETDVYKAIQRDSLRLTSPRWLSISAAARELVTGLLEKDPFKRYTIEQALAHPWVTGEAATDTPLDKSLFTSLTNFNARNKFKKEALRLVASTLSAADVQQLRATFHKIDADNSGVITINELASAFQVMGLKDKADVEALMKNLDTDGDGKISYEEFLVATAERQMVTHQNHIWWAFCEYDANGDGKITVEELRQVLKNEPAEMVEKWIKEYDTDGDGEISYEEFMKMLLPKDLKYRISAYS